MRRVIALFQAVLFLDYFIYGTSGRIWASKTCRLDQFRALFFRGIHETAQGIEKALEKLSDETIDEDHINSFMYKMFGDDYVGPAKRTGGIMPIRGKLCSGIRKLITRSISINRAVQQT